MLSVSFATSGIRYLPTLLFLCVSPVELYDVCHIRKRTRSPSQEMHDTATSAIELTAWCSVPACAVRALKGIIVGTPISYRLLLQFHQRHKWAMYRMGRSCLIAYCSDKNRDILVAQSFVYIFIYTILFITRIENVHWMWFAIQ